MDSLVKLGKKESLAQGVLSASLDLLHKYLELKYSQSEKQATGSKLKPVKTG